MGVFRGHARRVLLAGGICPWLKDNAARLAQHQMYLNVMYSRQCRMRRGILQNPQHEISSRGFYIVRGGMFSRELGEDLAISRCLIFFCLLGRFLSLPLYLQDAATQPCLGQGLQLFPPFMLRPIEP